MTDRTHDHPHPRASGLDDVSVADTWLSHVDGEAGRLVIAGHDVESLAGRFSFEALVSLLLRREPPSAATEEAMRRALGGARARAHERLPTLGAALDLQGGADAVRAALAQHAAPDGWSETHALEAIGAVPVYAGAWARRRAGASPVAPDPDASHASDALRLLVAGEITLDQARAYESYLVTVSDHGMNASTFTARVVASTGSDIVSAVVAALGALKGPLHGGAPGPVLDMLDAIGPPERARSFLEAELAAGRRIMGMGHRIYRVRDPRAEVLERVTRAVGRSDVGGSLARAREVERVAEAMLRERHPERPLRANVEFYTAVLLRALGLDPRAFTVAFATGRVVGWCAHVHEQIEHGRLIRPQSRYVGPAPAGPAGTPGAIRRESAARS